MNIMIADNSVIDFQNNNAIKSYNKARSELKSSRNVEQLNIQWTKAKRAILCNIT